MVTGLLKPKYGVPGFDVAGQVEAIGKNVKQFQPGDEVFGECNGACAEYARVGEGKIALKPTNLAFEEAAAIPTSALAALHALRDVGKVQPGQKVLVNGASGGVGTFAVQIAKSLGAQVTGVCSTTNVDMVSSIGADHVIDYTQEDFTHGAQRYDLIFDNVENRALADCRRVLTPRGTLILNSGSGAHGIELLVRLMKPLVLSPFVRQNLRRYLSIPNHDDLVVLRELFESRQLTPVIDKTYPLSETPAALAYIENGHARGKVVITL
jgi:NADPH:quinone reductase-like Zn-dependent oxidoreductase